MNKLLFEEIPNKSKAYMRSNRTAKTVLTVITAIFALLGALCLFLKEYFVAIIPFVFVFWLGFYLIKTILQEKQYLYIFDDKICYKRTYQRKEIQIYPSQYLIELKHAAPKSGYTIKFIFKSGAGKKLFVYKAVSLVPSPFQTEKNQWEEDLFAIGCVILDPQEVIINK